MHKDVTEHTETVHGQSGTPRWTSNGEPETATQTRRVTAIQDFATYTNDFRKHHITAVSTSGVAYAEYEPAYRYG